MHKYLKEMLECPQCQSGLKWEITEESKDRILSAEILCKDCSGEYSVRDGIGVFLTPDLQRNDLWESSSTGLDDFLAENPEVGKKLLEGPDEALSPVDMHFRGVILESKGKPQEARQAFSKARNAMYSKETLECMNSQLSLVIEELSKTDEPVVDLASGACTLAGRILKELNNQVVVTDFSPRILLKDKEWLIRDGLYDRCSLLAFDARRTPFKDNSVNTLTTFQGFGNIQEPGNLLSELGRIVSGRFLAITNFYSKEDETNAEVIKQAGLQELLYRENLLKHYTKSEWQVDILNSCRARANAAPTGAVLQGARVDLLPAKETTLEWCVLAAQKRR